MASPLVARDLASPPSRAAASDEALVLAIQRGDRDAVATLYARHIDALKSVGARVFPRESESEDLAHDVFLEAWERSSGYDPSRASVRTWLLVRMRSRALDRKRSSAYAARAPLAYDRRVAPESERPDVCSDRARVLRALAALPQERRALLVLAYFHGLSSARIAAQLDLPLGTVKSRVASALRALRARLEPPERRRARLRSA